jgi:hypothetical protein
MGVGEVGAYIGDFGEFGTGFLGEDGAGEAAGSGQRGHDDWIIETQAVDICRSFPHRMHNVLFLLVLFRVRRGCSEA